MSRNASYCNAFVVRLKDAYQGECEVGGGGGGEIHS